MRELHMFFMHDQSARVSSLEEAERTCTFTLVRPISQISSPEEAVTYTHLLQT